jgi:3'-phosphoadenosine 5'-phosphosulfate sulfotransferase (PAPS reductase)/FAD synthetase
MKKFHKYPLPIKLFKNQIYHLEQKAITKIMECFRLCENIMLAISFGKDSMTILHLLYKYKLLSKHNIKLIMFNRSGFDAKETLALRDYVIKKYEIEKLYKETFVENYISFINIKDIINQKTRKCFSDFVYNVLEIPRWEMMDKYNINGTLIGLRKQESKGRKINYILRGNNYYNKREKSIICQPIVEWGTGDIFRYAYTENMPLHPVYDKAREKGFEFMRERVNMLLDINFSDMEDRIQKMKILYPEDFKIIVQQIPEIRR